MKIVIAGGSGFLGKSLEKYFMKNAHEVWILTRKPKQFNEIYWDVSTSDTTSIGNWAEKLENADVLINMTGKSVDCRYNEANKTEILNSRISSTKILQKAIENCKNPPKVWLNSSSATIYVHAETQLMDEENGVIGDDFSMNICKSWEKAFFEDKLNRTRKVALRTAIVLGNEGEAIKKLKLITRLGLGGKQGRGNQKMSWIHVNDFCRAVEFVIQNTDIQGVINICSPNPLSNIEFMSELRKALKMPFGIDSPVWLLELASIFIQTETELLLKSRNVYPKRLLEHGFRFDFPTLDLALKELCG
jgi:uncharacterized protein